MKTDKQIKAEIKKLRELEPLIVQKSLFGDDNIGGLRASITALDKKMSEQEVYDCWENPDDYEENRSKIDSALEAVRWLEEDEEQAPSESGWPLKKDSKF